jgi:hypothetical protein
MSEEYESLRAEILKWQDRRFDLLKLSTTIVTSLLGLKLIFGAPASGTLWPLISSTLLLYLAAANLLTWYAGISNSILAAYIKVFHEKEPTLFHWETRLDKLNKRQQHAHRRLVEIKAQWRQKVNRWLAALNLNVNHGIAGLYFVLALVCILLPYATAKFQTPDRWWLWALLGTSATVFLATFILVVLFSYPRDYYERRWRQLPDEQGSSHQPEAA